MMNPKWASLGGIFGFLGVALGAFGAHALHETLDAHGHDIWRTAVLYQLVHALALLFVALADSPERGRALRPAAWAFTIGIIFFSGSLYGLALSKLSWLGPITPLGGLAFLFGWGWLTAVLCRPSRTLER